nr:unnamed protein product [Callosobruchus analis]
MYWEQVNKESHTLTYKIYKILITSITRYQSAEKCCEILPVARDTTCWIESHLQSDKMSYPYGYQQELPVPILRVNHHTGEHRILHSTLPILLEVK